MLGQWEGKYMNIILLIYITLKMIIKNWYAKVCEKHDWWFFYKYWEIPGSSKTLNNSSEIISYNSG